MRHSHHQGEKKLEKEDKTAERHVYECSYGTFARSIQLPFDVEPKSVKADFKNGVLTVAIPVPATAQTKAQRWRSSPLPEGFPA